MTLKDRLDQINQEARDFMAANPGAWSSGLVDDIDHWASYGIFIAEQLDDYLGRCFDREVQKGNVE